MWKTLALKNCLLGPKSSKERSGDEGRKVGDPDDEAVLERSATLKDKKDVEHIPF